MPMLLKITAWVLSLKISFLPNIEIDMTLAKRHFQAKTAELAAKAAGSDTDLLKNASAYELMLAQLYEDKRKLKEIRSIETKIELKRTLLPNYEPYINGVLAGGKGAQDDLLMMVMLWRLDTKDFDGALVIARYALQYQLNMSDKFQRNTATVIAEEIAINALSMLSQDGTDKALLLEDLVEAELLTRDHDMPDEVRSRLHKALGYCLRDIDPEQALVELKRAFKLHDKSGVKTDIGQLEKQLKKLAEAPEPITPVDDSHNADNSDESVDVVSLVVTPLDEPLSP